jgi:hypothetical protein
MLSRRFHRPFIGRGQEPRSEGGHSGAWGAISATGYRKVGSRFCFRFGESVHRVAGGAVAGR